MAEGGIDPGCGGGKASVAEGSGTGGGGGGGRASDDGGGYTLKRFKKIPVYVVEEHNDALQFIYSAIGGKKLPVEGTTLLHLDSHPDLLVSSSLRGEVARGGRRVLPELEIENWILPACAAGHLARVIWLRPPWAEQLADGTRSFRIGDEPDTGLVRVDSRETYFLADALYSPRLSDARTVSLTVAPLGDPDGLRADRDEEALAARLAAELRVAEPYVLDVDLDFFSTTNPFLSAFPQAGLYDLLEPLYAFEAPASEATSEQVERAAAERARQLRELSELFEWLAARGSLAEWGGERGERFEAVSRLAARLAAEWPATPVDWALVHTAGCTRDHGGLPVHVSSEAQIERLVERSVEPLLRALPPPVLVTVARSSCDDYCPPHQVDRIQELVLAALDRVWAPDKPRLYFLED